jgi:hypothetical protein
MLKNEIVSAKIEVELDNIKRLQQRVKKAWDKSRKTGDDLFLDSVALNLQSYYAAIENVFTHIAGNVDKKIPHGVGWHKDLAEQMSIPVKGVRGIVITVKTKNSLDEYRAFRHVVRNVYAFNLNPAKVKPLVANLNKITKMLENDLRKLRLHNS